METTYNNDRRFIFNNWSNQDFTGQWGGVPTLIKAGETKEFVMHLALHFAKHFVDREMMKEGKENMLAVEEARKPYMDRTVSEITGDVDSPALAALKKKIEEEVHQEQKGDKKEKKTKEVKPEVTEAEEGSKEFEDLK